MILIKGKKIIIIRERLPFSFFLYVSLYFLAQFLLFSLVSPVWCARVSACRPFFTASSLLDCVPDLCGASLPEYISLPPTSFFLISKPSYFTHVTVCNLRSSRAAVFHPARPGARQSISAILVSTWKRRALPSAPLIQQTDSKAVHTGKWVRRRRSFPYLLFPSVTHTWRDSGGKGWLCVVFEIAVSRKAKL